MKGYLFDVVGWWAREQPLTEEVIVSLDTERFLTLLLSVSIFLSPTPSNTESPNRRALQFVGIFFCLRWERGDAGSFTGFLWTLVDDGLVKL